MVGDAGMGRTQYHLQLIHTALELGVLVIGAYAQQLRSTVEAEVGQAVLDFGGRFGRVGLGTGGGQQFHLACLPVHEDEGLYIVGSVVLHEREGCPASCVVVGGQFDVARGVLLAAQTDIVGILACRTLEIPLVYGVVELRGVGIGSQGVVTGIAIEIDAVGPYIIGVAARLTCQVEAGIAECIGIGFVGNVDNGIVHHIGGCIVSCYFIAEFLRRSIVIMVVLEVLGIGTLDSSRNLWCNTRCSFDPVSYGFFSAPVDNHISVFSFAVWHNLNSNLLT